MNTHANPEGAIARRIRERAEAARPSQCASRWPRCYSESIVGSRYCALHSSVAVKALS